MPQPFIIVVGLVAAGVGTILHRRHDRPTPVTIVGGAIAGTTALAGNIP